MPPTTTQKSWTISEVGYVGFDVSYYLVSREGKYPHKREYMKEKFKTREAAQEAINQQEAARPMNPKTPTHTPTPLRISSRRKGRKFEFVIWTAREFAPTVLGYSEIAVCESQANAAHIVRCVNNFDALLEACKVALAERIGQPSRVISEAGIKVLREAIAKAEGK